MRLGIACSAAAAAATTFDPSAWGFDGYLLSTPYDASPARDGSAVQAAIRPGLVALDPQLDFAGKNAEQRGAALRALQAAIRVAAGAACPFVLVGGAAGGPGRANALEHTIQALQTASELARSCGVTLALCNSGALQDTRSLWHVQDVLRSLPVRICFDPETADVPASISVPRFAGRLALVRMRVSPADDASKVAARSRLLELLRGVAYSQWLVLQVDTAAAELPAHAAQAARAIREELARPVVPLSAYKGDRNAPRFVSRTAPAKG